MALWTQLIIEMIWHILGIGLGILLLAVIAYYAYKKTHIYKNVQDLSFFVANFLSVISVLFFLIALISSALEGLIDLLIISSFMFVASFYVAILSDRLRRT
jgi:hypothetical protein